jgi:hypothetical protein
MEAGDEQHVLHDDVSIDAHTPDHSHLSGRKSHRKVPAVHGVSPGFFMREGEHDTASGDALSGITTQRNVQNTGLRIAASPRWD